MKHITYVVIAVMALATVGCHKKEAAAPQAAAVNAITVVQQDYPWTMEYPAQVAGSLDVQIRAQVGGILQARLYDEGEFVEQGTQLFQIDDKEYAVALEKARGTLAQAQAEVKRNKRTYQRMKTLRAENAVSQQDYDNALSAYETAQANVQVAQAGVNNAEINLGYTKVTAPISGIAGKENQTVGSLISSAGESGLLTTMVQIDPLYVNFSMPGSQFEKLVQGYRAGTIYMGDTNNPTDLEDMNYREKAVEDVPIYVEVLLSNGKEYPRRGKLIFFDSSENTQTSSIAIKAAIANPARTSELIPGQFVRVRLVGAVFKNAILVPASAVLVSPNGLMAYVIKEDNTVELRPVEGELQNDMYIVSSGLKAGERVINGGLVKIRPGMLVAPTMEEFTVSEPQEKVEQPSDDGRDLATLKKTIEDATAPDERSLPDTSVPPAADTTPSVDMPNPVAQTPAVPTAATGN